MYHDMERFGIKHVWAERLNSSFCTILYMKTMFRDLFMHILIPLLSTTLTI